MEFLTTSEAAEYLRLGERKLYELVTAGAIPCSKVTGKWLFPRHELDLWVLSGLAHPEGMIAADVPPIVGGSQDDLLEWALRESGSALASLNEVGGDPTCFGLTPQDFHARNAKAAPAALERLKRVVIENGNVFAELMKTVRVCSLGQITKALFEVGGEYRRSM